MNTLQFFKASIKRPYNSISNLLKNSVPSMQEGESGDVNYCVEIENNTSSFSSSHLAAAYIADRIEDIKKARLCDNLCLVLSVFTTFESLCVGSPLFHS